MNRGGWLMVAILVMVVFLSIITYCYRFRIIRGLVMNRLPRNDPEGCLCINGQPIGDPIGRRLHNLYIHDEEAFFMSVFSRGEVGFGESYTRGEWTSPDLIGLMCFLVRSVPIGSRRMPAEARQDDAKNISHHYDVSNDFYGLFLTDPWRAYSCGIWDDEGTDLASAQKRKIDIIIEKLRVPVGCHVLDIGSGWGRIADYVSKKCGCRVVGITLSKEQHDFCADAFPSVDVRLMNFLEDEPPGRFSRIYSIGMFEHVRAKNYHRFFRRIRESMADDSSRFVLHSIITTYDELEPMDRQQPSFVSTHIFPGGQMPTMKWIRDSLRDTDLKIVHQEIFSGQHYAQTLRAWRENLERSHVDDQTLFRRYIYYLTTCEALFRTGRLGVVHLVIMPGTQHTVRDNFVYPH